MSEPERPDDRELDAFLERRSDISRAYRADTQTQTAPETLDAGLLAQAAQPAVLALRARRLQRWRVPLTMAASLVVVVGVLRLTRDDAAARRQTLAPQVTVDAATATAHVAPVTAAAEAVVDPADRTQEDKRKDAGGAALPSPRIDAAKKAEQKESRHPAAPAEQPASRGVLGESLPPPPVASSTSKLAPPPSAAAPVAADEAPSAATAAARDAAPSQGLAAESLSKLQGVAKRAESEQRDNAWQAARYQGMALGHATLDDIIRRWGPAQSVDQSHMQTPLPEGRVARRLLEYSSGVDARGPVRIQVDTNSQALASVSVTLRPALALKTVEAQEKLTPPATVRAADAPLCAAAPESVDRDLPYPQYRIYPAQGIYLLLTAPDTVVEIRYFDVCNY